MDKMTENFYRSEFACRCGCGFDSIDTRLVSFIQKYVRDAYRAPVIINSGCRCKAHNENVDGLKRSRHLTGEAADFFVRGVELKSIYDRLCGIFPSKYGLILYDTFIHFDVSERYYRSDRRK